MRLPFPNGLCWRRAYGWTFYYTYEQLTREKSGAMSSALCTRNSAYPLAQGRVEVEVAGDFGLDRSLGSII